MINLIIADDQEIIRSGFTQMLEDQPHITICAQATNGTELLPLTLKLAPDIVISDIKMPGNENLEAIRQIRKLPKHVKLIILSHYADFYLLNQLSQLKVNGYLVKNISKEELIQAIHTVNEGGTYYSQEIQDKMDKLRKFTDPDHLTNSPLSRREREVLSLLCKGLSAKQIAMQINISHRTVEKHTQMLLKKTGKANHGELIRFALDQGLYRSTTSKA